MDAERPELSTEVKNRWEELVPYLVIRILEVGSVEKSLFQNVGAPIELRVQLREDAV